MQGGEHNDGARLSEHNRATLRPRRCLERQFRCTGLCRVLQRAKRYRMDHPLRGSWLQALSGGKLEVDQAGLPERLLLTPSE